MLPVVSLLLWSATAPLEDPGASGTLFLPVWDISTEPRDEAPTRPPTTTHLTRGVDGDQAVLQMGGEPPD